MRKNSAFRPALQQMKSCSGLRGGTPAHPEIITRLKEAETAKG
jgi:hypothetical protein